jgi:hypothetical protein
LTNFRQKKLEAFLKDNFMIIFSAQKAAFCVEIANHFSIFLAKIFSKSQHCSQTDWHLANEASDVPLRIHGLQGLVRDGLLAAAALWQGAIHVAVFTVRLALAKQQGWLKV